jgi:hypothetical protein
MMDCSFLRPSKTWPEATQSCSTTSRICDFNQKLMYLGSVITEDLDNNININARIRKVNTIVYSFVNFWRRKGLTVKMKKAFYIAATIVNILLWGYESLTIRKEDLHRLEGFYHITIRFIFNILNGSKQ